MKRFVYILILCLSAVAVINSQEIQVTGVTGQVKMETSPGVWTAVTPQTKLSLNSNINTGLNSSLDLLINGEALTIKSMQKGIMELLIAEAQKANGGISMGGGMKSSGLSIGESQGRTNISTASTRASDAQNDLDWADSDE